eukprot:gb/GFBE01019996.1/.p1 GENE.gb/GFBE01019996.1/~~gb/GFBE01019996.1/.p1  ORF type:complete len:487 (+),score=112.63 gb/GFBE01019996.1/:1-1461(+)
MGVRTSEDQLLLPGEGQKIQAGPKVVKLEMDRTGVPPVEPVEAAAAPKTALASGSAHEAYAKHVKEVMAAADWPWPEHVMMDPKKQPRFIHSVEELKHEFQFGSHMNEVVVFPGGLHALGQDEVLHPEVGGATRLDATHLENGDSRTAYDVLESLADMGALDKLKGKVRYRVSSESRKDIPAGNWKNECLAGKWATLKDKCPPQAKTSVYIAEMRMLEKQPAQDDTLRCWRRSSLSTTMRERMYKLGMDVQSMLYWDDYSEGFFIGAGSSGYDLHADCIPTSNVGSVFAGHKLLAIWSFPDDTKDVLRRHGREQFCKPLTDRQVQALEGACCVALAPPGSIYIFSGTCAHAVCNVGFSSPNLGKPVPSLVISSYEAFVGLNLEHAKTMAQVCNATWDDGAETDEDIQEFEEDMADEVSKLQKHLRERDLGRKETEALSTALDFLCSECRGIKAALRDAEAPAEDEDSEGSEPKRMRYTAVEDTGDQ